MRIYKKKLLISRRFFYFGLLLLVGGLLLFKIYEKKLISSYQLTQSERLQNIVSYNTTYRCKIFSYYSIKINIERDKAYKYSEVNYQNINNNFSIEIKSDSTFRLFEMQKNILSAYTSTISDSENVMTEILLCNFIGLSDKEYWIDFKVLKDWKINNIKNVTFVIEEEFGKGKSREIGNIIKQLFFVFLIGVFFLISLLYLIRGLFLYYKFRNISEDEENEFIRKSNYFNSKTERYKKIFFYVFISCLFAYFVIICMVLIIEKIK